jgi:hypothetical protein
VARRISLLLTLAARSRADSTEECLHASTWYVLPRLSRTSAGLRNTPCVYVRRYVYFRGSKTDEDSVAALSGSMTHKVKKDSGSQAKERADGPPDVREVVQ